MPDITMCLSAHCPLAQNCYRAQATPSQHQSWAAFGIISQDGKTVKCGFYVPIVSGSEK